MPQICLFTVTTGRSGTAYLAELLRANLPQAEVHHEILRYDAWGVDTPDLSDLAQFNAFGSTAKVQDFWRQKLGRIAAKPVAFYAETSHILAKAGLIENLAPLAARAQVVIILLRRDLLKTISSFQARGDFLNKGNYARLAFGPGLSTKYDCAFGTANALGLAGHVSLVPLRNADADGVLPLAAG